jgi:hypothetical protein
VDLVSGDLVVDASSQHSELLRWLPEIGRARCANVEPCGIFYVRFYRLRDVAASSSTAASSARTWAT